LNGHGATIAQMPFGGVKQSASSRTSGMAALDQYRIVKHVAIAGYRCQAHQ
jgi:acyl-CoA reductase-like NAD-dependent aldehyde dehydrogenase